MFVSWVFGIALEFTGVLSIGFQCRKIGLPHLVRIPHHLQRNLSMSAFFPTLGFSHPAVDFFLIGEFSGACCVISDHPTSRVVDILRIKTHLVALRPMAMLLGDLYF